MGALSYRDLNRATLARQMLLERSGMSIEDAVGFLLGLQAQQTHDPYIALWTRLAGFTHEALTDLIVRKVLLRATSMRGTLHLHTVPDMIGIRAALAPYLERQWTSGFRKRFGESAPREAVQKAGVEILDSGPMTAGDLQKALHARFPGPDPLSMSSMLQVHETLIQVPPTRIWGSGHPPLLSRIESWVGPVDKRPIDRKLLVRRYLAAFGPASVADMQTWSRMTLLKAEFAALRDELIAFTDPEGKELFDLPGSPRPGADAAAPVRFLPLYDNVYLGYANRRRMLGKETAELINMFAEFKPPVLIDGTVAAGWSHSEAKGVAAIEVRPYRALLKSERAETVAEGEALARFLSPEAERAEVRFID